MTLSFAQRFLVALVLSLGFAATVQAAPPRATHVVVVIEENRSFQTIIGSKDAPYINALAGEGALFTRSFAVTHPSEPNYLALFAGDTEGLTDDSCPHSYTGANLADELTAKGLGFTLYAESLPQEGFADCGTLDKLYRRKHNPVPNFTSVPTEADQPFSAFPADYSKLPTVAYVIPNMMDDMHDGTVPQADAWLKQNLDGYAQWALKNHGLLIVTWDEDDGTQNNQIPTLVVGQDVKPGRYDQKIDHYSLLRTLTDMYRLKPIGHAKQAKPIKGIWVSRFFGHKHK
ncbi:MAG TPA: alkaline phosphatase family protein [Gammaproteobacteria bacterium]|nr:alkaline phosphatase family protein [Gammaproteobacteria bacterium]